MSIPEQFDSERFMTTTFRVVVGLALLFIIHEMRMTELHQQEQIIELKNQMILHMNRTKGIDVILMTFYLAVGYFSAFAIPAIMETFFGGFGAPSIKEPTLWDSMMFSYESICDVLLNIPFSECLLWSITLMLLCIVSLSLYGA